MILTWLYVEYICESVLFEKKKAQVYQCTKGGEEQRLQC